MKNIKKKRPRQWTEGTVQEFLELSQADVEYIEIRLAISRLLKQSRKEQHLTQEKLANKLHTSQSRVAKMERGDPAVSLDLLLKAVLSLGLTRRQIASVL